MILFTLQQANQLRIETLASYSYSLTTDHICETKGSKPIACRFLDIELEARIGESGFRVCNSQFSWCQ